MVARAAQVASLLSPLSLCPVVRVVEGSEEVWAQMEVACVCLSVLTASPSWLVS